MNNAQFRRLVQDTPSTASQNGANSSQRRDLGGQTPALGSRMRSAIPMTPRSLPGTSHKNEFARQLAERNAEANGQPGKKFRSSAAPKGSKLGSGYTDRTQMRISEEDDEKSVRVKALEDQVKLGQLAPETFEALREQIIGSDVKAVHLVKGLDYKLLARVRKGEDVLSEPEPKEDETTKAVVQEKAEPELDVDEEFEKLEGKEIQPLAKEERIKKGEMAAPPLPLAGKKRTRDDILKELKASRATAAEEAKARLPQLGPKFSKVGGKKESSRIEKDSKGREILITTDAEGNTKRKVKKAKTEDDNSGLLMPDKAMAPLGMDVSGITPTPAPEVDQEDDDIFGEVGKEYNPLAGLENDDDDDDNDSDDSTRAASLQPQPKPPKQSSPQPSADHDSTTEPISRPPKPPTMSKRNYFNDSSTTEDTAAPTPSLQDPTILAALKKASTLHPLSSATDEDAAKLVRHKKMLENSDRDAEDMDMEFGSSRFGDQEDGEDGGGKVELSEWRGGGEEEEGEGKQGGRKEGKERKRGGKKRKGDVNSAADVLKVMEAKKKEKEK